MAAIMILQNPTPWFGVAGSSPLSVLHPTSGALRNLPTLDPHRVSVRLPGLCELGGFEGRSGQG